MGATGVERSSWSVMVIAPTGCANRNAGRSCRRAAYPACGSCRHRHPSGRNRSGGNGRTGRRHGPRPGVRRRGDDPAGAASSRNGGPVAPAGVRAGRDLAADSPDDLVAGGDHGLRGRDLRLAHQVLHRPVLVASAQGHHGSGGAGSRRPSRAVQEGLGLQRRVGVDHQRDVVDVDAAGGDVGGDQHPELTGGEGVEVPLAGALGQVAVQFAGRDACGGELPGQARGPVLGPREHQRPAGSGDQVGEDRLLVLPGDHEELVVDLGSDPGVDGVLDRVGQVPVHHRGDVVVQGGREQHPLPLLRHRVEQSHHRRKEPHVGHQVGLVEDGDRHRGQVTGTLGDQVLEPPGGGDDHVDAGPQLAQLGRVGDPPVDRHRLQPQGTGQECDRLVDLHGEFTRRHQDEGARLTRTALAPRFQEAGDHRQREGDRLARAGPAAPQDVPAGEGVGQAGRLDRERVLDAVAAEHRDEFGP